MYKRQAVILDVLRISIVLGRRIFNKTSIIRIFQRPLAVLTRFRFQRQGVPCRSAGQILILSFKTEGFPIFCLNGENYVLDVYKRQR